MRIDVIGAGGIGSYLIPVLMKNVLECPEVHVWDEDILEKGNLYRQLFPKRFIGKCKAEAMSIMYPGIIPHNSYVVTPTDLEGTDMIFACPDNMPARKVALQSSDIFGVPAFICGNTYESASASYYEPTLYGSPMDYRVRYAGSMDNISGDPTRSCTGEAQVSDPQLAIANQFAATYALGLLWFWSQKSSFVRDTPVFNKSPIEYRWVPSAVQTVTIQDCINQSKMEIK